MASQKQVISWLEDIIPDIKRTRDPEGVMLKFARSSNLSEAQLEKLAQVYNSAKTINFLEKAANRGDSFHVVDATALLARYADVAQEKKASGNSWIQAEAEVVPFPKSSVKSALHEPEFHSVEPDSTRATVRDHLQAKEAFRRNLETHDEVIYNARAEVSEKVAKLVARLHASTLDFSEIESDSLYVDSATKEACDLVVARLPKALNIKRASGAGKKRLVVDSHGFVADLVAIQDAIGVAKAATTLKEKFVKEANELAEAFDQGIAHGTKDTGSSLPSGDSQIPQRPRKPISASGSSGGSKPPGGIPGSGGEFSSELVKLIQGIEAPKFPGDPAGMVGAMISDVMSGRKNRGQEHVDNEFDSTRSGIVVERLMFTDPIISQADPDRVISLANSIRERSPDLAMDINAMRAQLREQLQYDSMPANTSKDLAGIQKAINENNDSRRDSNRDRYSIAPSKLLGGGKS